MHSVVFTPFELPCGLTLKNRLAKAAMEENLANAHSAPDKPIFTLYKQWANGGAGLIITGNVMIDGLAMTGPGGIVLDGDCELAPFRQWAKEASVNDSRIIMQINHPGRQVYAAMKGKALAPSAIPLDLGKHSKLFAHPTEMTQTDIDDVIERFVITATRAEKAGFHGVEVHAAHGYLLAQFLSPLTNKRNDEWGGTLENRARLLLTIVKKIRAFVNKRFAVAVKLNSADFQHGGFEPDDALQVVKWLEPLGVDFIELSGGSYESPAMQGRTADERTLAREAWFLEFAQQIAQHTNLDIMTTGGINRLPTAEHVVNAGVPLVGMATALALTPNLPNQWRENPNAKATPPTPNWRNKTLNALAVMSIIKRQLRRLSQGKPTRKHLSPLISLVIGQIRMKKLVKRYKRRKL